MRKNNNHGQKTEKVYIEKERHFKRSEEEYMVS